MLQSPGPITRRRDNRPSYSLSNRRCLEKSAWPYQISVEARRCAPTFGHSPPSHAKPWPEPANVHQNLAESAWLCHTLAGSAPSGGIWRPGQHLAHRSGRTQTQLAKTRPMTANDGQQRPTTANTLMDKGSCTTTVDQFANGFV